VDRRLVERAQAGDAAAFDSLARSSADRLMAIAYRILRDIGRAEDAVQATLLTTWRELPGLRDPDRFDAWIHRLVVHASYAEARKARSRQHEVAFLPLHEPSTGDPYLTVNDRDQLERAFRRLSAEQRAVVVLQHELGLSQPEIAATLGIPVGTVKSRLHAAMSTLRAAVEADSRLSAPSLERTA
jgi:RNA polymerase sigma-70 factor (ECF subfamily)